MTCNKTSTGFRTLIVIGFIVMLAVLSHGCKLTTSPEEEKKSVFALRFYPSTLEIEGIDELAAADIFVDNASSLIAAHITVSFDPSIVEVTQVQTSGYELIFTDDGAEVQEIENVIDNVTGLVKIGIGAVKSGYTGAKGSGSLAIITFRSKKVGESALQFVNNHPDDIVTAVYSSRAEEGWTEKNPVTYNSTIIVSEKAVEPQD